MRRSTATLASGVAAVMAVVTACATNPATGKKQLMLVSVAQEIAMGQQADGEAVAAYGLYPDAKVQAYVDGLGKRLAARSERPDLPWSFRVVDDPAVNAFALPGGYIYVTRGIMAHLRSEAELAGVVGHEIGHVTGRHSAVQLSRQQLAMGGLIVGMAVKPELQEFAGLAQAGLGLLFLKYGRDMENEADHLGLRYMTREDYDPQQLVRVMGVLDRVTREAGGSRMPDWLATHPSPENRSARIRKELAATPTSSVVVRSAEYMRHLEGMVFGENPREGYFRANAFYHPDLRFRIAFPAGFRTQNEKQAVVGVSEAQDAAVLLTLATGASPEEAARGFFTQQQGMTIGRSGRDSIGGLPAYSALFEAATQEAILRGQVSFVAHDGRIYRILGYADGESFGRYQGALDGSIRSFAPLADPRYLNVQPRRIALVNLDQQMTLPEFARVYPSTVKTETIGLINGVEANQALPGGELAKRVVGGRLPE